jgi:glycolate oxidase FAD binding subunit
MGESACLIDDFGPLPVERPPTVADLSELVRRAAAAGEAIYPIGGGTMLCLGNASAKRGIAVDLRGLDQVIDYPARDMTITVEAGMTVARLQALLAPENQRLPIDVPRAEAATVGGILATNASGPRRFGYGTLRDYLLGFSAVNDEGQVIKAGGRVVKNVAGYDLCKLFVGSLGTLGIITQATLKLRPLPEQQALATLPCAAASLHDLLDLLHRSRTRPVCIDVLNPAAVAGLPLAGGSADAWLIVVGYEGNADAVKWQVQQLVREVHGKCGLEARIGATARPLWDALVEFVAPCEGDNLTFKANMLPSAVAEFCRQADALPERPSLQAHAGNGIVVGHMTVTGERAASVMGDLRSVAARGRGRVVVVSCPPAWKKTVSVWGPSAGDVGLMRAVKEKLDPRRLFNPGRFVEGI